MRDVVLDADGEVAVGAPPQAVGEVEVQPPLGSLQTSQRVSAHADVRPSSRFDVVLTTAWHLVLERER